MVRIMKLLRQKRDDDCGIACVAMLAGVTYERAKSKIFGDRDIELTQAPMLRDALRELGRKPARGVVPLRGRDYRTLEHPALLKVNPRKGGMEWHWVVWTGSRILDPKNPPYTLSWLRPVGYLRVD
jgi:ABC-type bacteriocin/lantibiotic exporter with double-glycine peptidase domain